MSITVTPANHILNETDKKALDLLEKFITDFNEPTFKIGYVLNEGIHKINIDNNYHEDFFYILLNIFESRYGFYNFLDVYLKKMTNKADFYKLNFKKDTDFLNEVESFIKLYYELKFNAFLSNEELLFLKSERESIFSELFRICNLNQ